MVAVQKGAWLQNCVQMVRSPTCRQPTEVSTFQLNACGKAARQCAAFFLFIVVVLMGHATVADAQQVQGKFRREAVTLVTSKGEIKIDTEIAESLDQKSLGLMFRTSLPDDQGMLFPYPRPQELTMWMRNTYIPLDMVFIRADGVVHRIEIRTEPLSERVIASQGDVTAVLELAGGAAERLGLKAGDRVLHAHFAPKK